MNKIVREKIPLVHCITNYVTVNDVANAILAVGGSPIMADDIHEVEEITAIASALVINIGTLNERTAASMLAAAATANKKNVPIILDPVGAGVSNLRNKITERLLKNFKLAAIRGNLSEIAFCAGKNAATRGVDSNDSDKKFSAAEIAKIAAEKYSCVAIITGAVDTVTDGKNFAQIKNGVPAMSKITGTGCMLSGILGAYIGACEDKFSAAVSAVASMGIAGEISFEKYSEVGTGSLHIGIIDALSKIDDGIISARGKIFYED
ncbi:MAG: hydroxyethylthiazole kinase [Selenomonadaceae bacterium]|nr:hydroxyethylthiazole kinase [Selenomonadaceae bacterium]